MKNPQTISGKIVDIVNQKIFEGTIIFENGKIISVKEEANTQNKYIIPGLIDSHIHVESSMLIPSEFARLAVTHGTVATVSDPHKIANVLGIDGIKYMIENGRKVPFKFYFGASSCVPATPFETSGATLGIAETEELLKMDEIKYLSEMMNFPGVLFDDDEVLKKLALAKKYNKPIDGHAPGVKGKDAEKYIAAGITTDHECFTLEEALDKVKYGMFVQIREGSAAKNFDALISLMDKFPDKIMFCSDDRHPNDLEKGHINEIVKRAIKCGYDPVKILRSCTYNPVKHYNLDVGLLREGDNADIVIIDNFDDFNILETYINGEKVAENGNSLINSVAENAPNKFNTSEISVNDLKVLPEGEKIKIIEALEGQLVTIKSIDEPKICENNIVSNIENDVLKIVVLNRYEDAKPAIAFIKNFGLQKGAIASTVAHDSHNIVAVGVDDNDIVKAINLLVREKGGVSVADKNNYDVLPLPVAGIMSNKDAYEVANNYKMIDKKAKELGCKLNAPYMTLSFMALLVIPEIKLSDKGLFDGAKFEFTSLFE